MSQESFDERIDNTLLSIEEAIDDSGQDIDYDTIAGILTLIFPDDSKVIINRQSATGQLWIAARSGGFHLDWQADDWFCVAESLNVTDLLNRICSDQLAEPVTLNLE